MICPVCGYRSADLRETCRRCGAPIRGTVEKTLGDADAVADDRIAWLDRPDPSERQAPLHPSASTDRRADGYPGWPAGTRPAVPDRVDRGDSPDATDQIVPDPSVADRGGWGPLTAPPSPAQPDDRRPDAGSLESDRRAETSWLRAKEAVAPPPDVLDLAEAQIEPPEPDALRPGTLPAAGAPPTAPERPEPPRPDPAAEELRARALTAGDRDPRYASGGSTRMGLSRESRPRPAPEGDAGPHEGTARAAADETGGDGREASKRPADGGLSGARPGVRETGPLETDRPATGRAGSGTEAGPARESGPTTPESGRMTGWRLEELEPVLPGRPSGAGRAAGSWGGDSRPLRDRLGLDVPPGVLGSAVSFPPVGRAYAGFWVRLLAAAVDWTILGLVFLLMAVGALAVAGGSGALAGRGMAERLSGIRGLLDLFFSLVVAVYYVFFTWAAAGTPGKAALGLRVVRADGKPLGVGRSLLRFTGYFLELIPGGLLAFFVGGLTALSAGFVLQQPLLAAILGGLASLLTFLGYLWIAIDPRKQAWHDKLAGTAVVRL